MSNKTDINAIDFELHDNDHTITPNRGDRQSAIVDLLGESRLIRSHKFMALLRIDLSLNKNRDLTFLAPYMPRKRYGYFIILGPVEQKIIEVWIEQNWLLAGDELQFPFSYWIAMSTAFPGHFEVESRSGEITNTSTLNLSHRTDEIELPGFADQLHQDGDGTIDETIIGDRYGRQTAVSKAVASGDLSNPRSWASDPDSGEGVLEELPVGGASADRSLGTRAFVVFAIAFLALFGAAIFWISRDNLKGGSTPGQSTKLVDVSGIPEDLKSISFKNYVTRFASPFKEFHFEIFPLLLMSSLNAATEGQLHTKLNPWLNQYVSDGQQELDSSSETAINLMAVYFMHIGKFEKASKEMSKVNSQNALAATLINKAIISYKLRDYAAATAYLVLHRGRFPQDSSWPPLMLRGLIASEESNWNLARGYFDNALKIAPYHPLLIGTVIKRVAESNGQMSMPLVKLSEQLSAVEMFHFQEMWLPYPLGMRVFFEDMNSGFTVAQSLFNSSGKTKMADYLELIKKSLLGGKIGSQHIGQMARQLSESSDDVGRSLAVQLTFLLSGKSGSLLDINAEALGGFTYQKSRLLRWQGHAYYEKNDYDRSIESYKKSLESGGDAHPASLVGLGVIGARLGQFESARRDFNGALQMDSEYWPARLRIQQYKLQQEIIK